MSSCQSCVEGGHTWCENSDFFNEGSVCLDNNSGFFGNCNDVSFGASEYDSQFDCAFGTEQGELVFAAIIIAGLCGLGFLVALAMGMAGARRQAGNSNKHLPRKENDARCALGSSRR